MDAFANTSTLTFLQTYHDENIRIVDNKYQPCIGHDLLRQGKCVAFIFTEALIASALVEKASKLSKPDNSPIKAYAYYGNMDEKQKQKDFSNIDVI
ncbi:9307_t:CDS:2 [Funneliformis geosporum]|uniref:9307_t:CDS:1 n=1 Tax=Funneliformis geosporum TaxID=1117311 RepID=A0A9W4X013_9GLOM|nr:9307_t:CDS:2 [Funneliformis geosporum]